MIEKGFAYKTIQRRTGLSEWRVKQIARECGGVGAYRRGETRSAIRVLESVATLLLNVRVTHERIKQ